MLGKINTLTLTYHYAMYLCIESSSGNCEWIHFYVFIMDFSKQTFDFKRLNFLFRDFYCGLSVRKDIDFSTL